MNSWICISKIIGKGCILLWNQNALMLSRRWKNFGRIFGKHFTTVNEHQAPIYLLDDKQPTKRWCQKSIKLSSYNYTIKLRPEGSHCKAYPLSQNSFFEPKGFGATDFLKGHFAWLLVLLNCNVTILTAKQLSPTCRVVQEVIHTKPKLRRRVVSLSLAVTLQWSKR